MLSARKQLDVITAYRQVGTYRGAAEMCGVTHKTVKRIIERGEATEQRVARRRNYESVRTLVSALRSSFSVATRGWAASTSLSR